MNKRALYSVFLICIVLYIFIPHFLLPNGTSARFLVLNILWIYFLANLLLHQKVGIGIEKFERYPEAVSLSSFLRKHKALIIILILNLSLHIYPVFSRTILMHYDEPAVVQHGLGLFTRISSGFENTLNVEFSWVTSAFYILLVALLISLRRKAYDAVIAVTSYFDRHVFARIGLIILLILASYAYFLFIKTTPFHGSLYRYPPMFKLLYLVTYTMFGIREFGPRAIQVLLGTIGVAYLYRLVLLYYDRRTALLASLVFVFSPLVGYYFNYAELGLGTVSISIVITFYFVRFLRRGSDGDLLTAFALIGIGFLYKRPILLLLFLIPAYLLLFRRGFVRGNLGKLGKLLWVALMPIVPFLVIGRLFSTPYVVAFSRLIDDHIYSYFTLLYSQISIAMFVLFLASLVYVFARERNDMNVFTFITFLAFYVLYTLYPFDKVDRFSLSFMPTVAIFLAVFIVGVLGRHKAVLRVVTVVICAYLISVSTIVELPEIQPKFVLYRNLLLEHYPVDRAMKWAFESRKDGKCLCVGVKNGPFYRDKYGIDRGRIVEIRSRDFAEFGPDELASFLGQQNIECIIMPEGRHRYQVAPRIKRNIELAHFALTRQFENSAGNKIIVYSSQDYEQPE